MGASYPIANGHNDGGDDAMPIEGEHALVCGSTAG
jgi:hypothetical protein